MTVDLFSSITKRDGFHTMNCMSSIEAIYYSQYATIHLTNAHIENVSHLFLTHLFMIVLFILLNIERYFSRRCSILLRVCSAEKYVNCKSNHLNQSEKNYLTKRKGPIMRKNEGKNNRANEDIHTNIEKIWVTPAV